MLRIDLLPSYVAQRRLTRQLSVLFIGLFALIVVTMLAMEVPLVSAVNKETALELQAENYQTQVKALKSQTDAVTALKPPFDTKLKFVTDVTAHNLAYPNFYRRLAHYTVPTILYSSMTLAGTALSISAYTPKLAELSNYLAHIWNDPDLASVNVSAFPGYKQEYDPSSKDYTLPQLPPGYIAHFKNSPILVKSFTVANGVVTQIRSGTEKAQTTKQTQGKKPLFDASRSGFDFTVTAVLKAAIPEPTDPTSASTGAAGAPAGAPAGPPKPGGR